MGALGDSVLISGFTPLGVGQNSYWRDTKTFNLVGTGPDQHVVHDQGARLVIATSDTFIQLRGVATTGNSSLGDTIDVTVNGSYFTTAQFPGPTGSSIGVNATVSVALPPGPKMIELIEQRCALNGITCTGTVIPAPVPHRTLLAIGASGTEGYFAWDTGDVVAGRFAFVLSYIGRIMLSRRFDSVYRIGNSGFGITAYAIFDMATALTFVDTFVVPRCDGTDEQVILYEFCAGEQLANASTPTVFAQKCAILADATHSRIPSARVLFQTAVLITNPDESVPNAGGFIMQAYRDVMPPVAVGRPWVTVVDGKKMADQGTDLQDGKHMVPGDSTHAIGQVKAFNHLMTIF